MTAWSSADLRRVGDAIELELASRRCDGTMRGRDVRFVEAPADGHAAIDGVSHAKYDRSGPDPVSPVTGPDARTVTIRLVRSEP